MIVIDSNGDDEIFNEIVREAKDEFKCPLSVTTMRAIGIARKWQKSMTATSQIT